MTRRTFLNRLSAAAMGVVAAVYAPSCLRALEPVEEQVTFHGMPIVWVASFDDCPYPIYVALSEPVPHPTILP
jgi:hypothetical protein